MMNCKKTLLFVIIYVFISHIKIYAQNRDQDKIDSVFQYHFTILECSIKEDNKLDAITKSLCSDSTYYEILPLSIDFMEKVTGRKAYVEENYFATKKVTLDIMHKWKKWYINNKNRLLWDNTMQRVNRKDKDIYTNKLLPPY